MTLLKCNPLKIVSKLSIVIRRSILLQKTYNLAFKLVGYLPVHEKLIVFESFLGKQYSDNPRAIYEYLVQSNADYKILWSFDKSNADKFEDKKIHTIKRLSLKWLLVMPRAKYWVTNSRLPLWIPKPKHTTYLQTWHGTPLKKLAIDINDIHMPGTDTKEYKQDFIKESNKWDYLISPNRYSTDIFRRAFAFNNEMIESGYPRNDFLINSNTAETIDLIKLKNNLPFDKKVILYAPTWRDNQFHERGKYKFDLQLDLEQLRNELGDNYIIVLRMHYLVAENMDLTPFEGFAYDFSYYEDIRELYLVSDILITDYSSVFFDYANLKRPIIFFVYDIEEYRDKLRGFYFDFEENAPGPLVRETDEVISCIKTIDIEGYRRSQEFDDFYEKFCSLEDGLASKRVVEEVFKV